MNTVGAVANNSHESHGTPPDLGRLESLAEALRGEFCRRGEITILDAYVAALEAQEALGRAKEAIALAERVVDEPMSGGLFSALLELEMKRPPQLEWSQSEHASLGPRFVGQSADGVRAVIYKARSDIEMWTWSLHHPTLFDANGEALSALLGALAAETELAARGVSFASGHGARR